MSKCIGVGDVVEVVALDHVDDESMLHIKGTVLTTFGSKRGVVLFIKIDEDFYRTFYLWQLEKISSDSRK